MSATEGGGPPDRLENAIEIYLRHVESGSADAGGLLQRHAGLRDLLEPMLASGRLDPGLGAGATPRRESRKPDLGVGDTAGS